MQQSNKEIADQFSKELAKMMKSEEDKILVLSLLPGLLEGILMAVELKGKMVNL